MNTERLIDTDRLKLFMRRSGKGAPLLFLGGSNFDMRLRAPVFDSLLVQNFDVVAYEPRGIGRSDSPTGVWDMADFAEDAVALMNALEWDYAFILGESFGAMTALELALRHPERVCALALSAGSAGGEGGSSFPIERFLELDPRSRAEAALSLQDKRFKKLQQDRPKEAEIVIAKRMAFEDLFFNTYDNAAGYRKLLSARTRHDCWNRLEKIQVSTRIMAGEYDGQANAQLSQSMANKIKNVNFTVYQGGHGFCFSSPEPVNDLILHWHSDSM